MSDIVKRLRAPAYWISGSSEGHEGDNSAPLEAARTIEILRVELARINMENDRLTRTNRAKREHRDKLLEAKAKDADEITRLRAALREIVAMDEVAIVEWKKGDGWLHQRVARTALKEDGDA